VTRKIDAAVADATPPATFNAFDPEVVRRLLGPEPHERVLDDRGLKWREFRADRPKDWPEDGTGREYLHRALVRLLQERGRTPEAGVSIRRDLEDGRIRAVFIDDQGDVHRIEPKRWRGASAGMYWKGEVELGTKLGPIDCNIYLTTDQLATASSEPKPLDLSESEALCRLLLHLAGSRSARQIANQSTGTDFAVPERTVSYLLKKARELLDEKSR
jgi:hypothetical protein